MALFQFRDTAYTSLAIDSHTDCNYFQDTPGRVLMS